MSNIVKVCKVHGELEEKDIYLSPFKIKNGKSYCIKCKSCTNISSKKYYKKRMNDHVKKNEINNIILRKEREKNFKFFFNVYSEKILKINPNASYEFIKNRYLEILEFNRLKKLTGLKQINGIGKICIYHGPLTEKDISFKKSSVYNTSSCKVCKNSKFLIDYSNNKDKYKKIQKLFFEKNINKKQLYYKRWLERIPNNYVLKNFIKNSKLKSEDVPQELLDLKKDLIRLKRKIKEKTECLK